MLGLGGLEAHPTGVLAAWRSGAKAPGGLKPAPHAMSMHAEYLHSLDSKSQDGAGAGGDVAVFQAFELLSDFPGRGDGGVVDVGVLDEDFHDGVVVNGPRFEIREDVRGIAGFDEVDFVRSIFMIAARAGVRGVSSIGQESVTVGGLIWHFCLSDSTLPDG